MVLHVGDGFLVCDPNACWVVMHTNWELLFDLLPYIYIQYMTFIYFSTWTRITADCAVPYRGIQ